MTVPTLSPILRVLIDGVKKQMMNEPDVGGHRRIEAMMVFKLEEKVLPLLTVAIGNIVP